MPAAADLEEEEEGGSEASSIEDDVEPMDAQALAAAARTALADLYEDWVLKALGEVRAHCTVRACVWVFGCMCVPVCRRGRGVSICMPVCQSAFVM